MDPACVPAAFGGLLIDTNPDVDPDTCVNVPLKVRFCLVVVLVLLFIAVELG